MNGPLDLHKICNDLNLSPMLKGVLPVVGKFLKLKEVNQLYNDSNIRNKHDADQCFFSSVLKELNVTANVELKDLDKIPKDGPLMVISNHPFGCLDGLVMGSLLNQVRPDFKLLVTDILGLFEAMNPWFFKVNISNSDSASRNFKALKDSLNFLKKGNCLGVFPAGEVSSFSIKKMEILDSEWSSHPFALALKAKASILPISFCGQNSFFFQSLGVIHPTLRTLMLGRELINKRGANITLKIGNVIPYQKIKGIENAGKISEFCRIDVETLLRNSGHSSEKSFPLSRIRKNKVSKLKPIIPPVDSDLLKKEVELLSPEQILVEKSGFRIYCIKSESSGVIMQEIARLREKTFREVGEGTGNAFDQDEFDQWYHQLFAWDLSAGKIAGGYRLGVVEDIIKKRGKGGMYAASEFSLKRGFYSSLGNAIEVGRSFITEEYQRKYSLLSLIWRAIGEFMNQRPEHFVLYGPVSISGDYTQLSRNLLFRFLRTNRWSKEIARKTKAKYPFKPNPLSRSLVDWVKKEGRTLDDVSAIISRVEPDGKGVPVLIKHYLKLRGSFVGFAVDPDFGNVLDGLIVVDIRNMEDKQLLNYFGKHGKKRIIKSREKMLLEQSYKPATASGRDDRVLFPGKRNP